MTTKTLAIKIASYKKAQVFKKDYVRKGGSFLRFDKTSGNHSDCHFELEDGEEFDARGSVYQVGATRWTATDCQSWAKFKNMDGTLKAFNFDGAEIGIPTWCRAELVQAEKAA